MLSTILIFVDRCEINTFNSNGATPLWSVCSKGLTELAKIFIHEVRM